LTEATAAPGSPLGNALDVVVRYAADAQFDKLISSAVDQRRWLEAIKGQAAGEVEAAFATVENFLRKSLSVRAAITCADVHEECAGVLSEDELLKLRSILWDGSKTDRQHAEILEDALRQTTASLRAAALEKYFVVGKGEARKSLMTNGLGQTHSDLLARCQQAQARFFALAQEFKALTLIEASLARYRIAGAVLERYSDARNAAGALDFEDLIAKTT